FNQLGGIELSSAYKLVKAISKKTTDVIAKYKPNFIEGAVAKGVSREQAQELFELILKFGGYGFNKSHSTRYAIVAFQTAYMKTYHPLDYMAALRTYEMGDTTKVVDYIDECKRLAMPDGKIGIKVLPPDVNTSDKDFTPIYVTEAAGKRKREEKTGVIRFGLMAVKGVGQKAVEAIIAQRQARGVYPSLYDFCDRVDLHQVTKSTIDSLVKCGAFSSMKANRQQLLNVLEKAVEMGHQAQEDRRLGQMNMFGSGDADTTRITLGVPDAEEMPKAQLLKYEKDFLGFYITSHPLAEKQADIDRYTTASSREVGALAEGTEVTVGAMISQVRKRVTKNGRSAGQQMAILTLEDLEGQIDATIFAESLAEILKRSPDSLTAESIVFVKGKVDKRREKPGLLVNDVIPLDDAAARLTTAVKLDLSRTPRDPEIVGRIKPVLAKHRGGAEVWLQLNSDAGRNVVMQLGRNWYVRPAAEMVAELETVLGGGAVQLAGAGARRIKRLEQQRLFQEESGPTPEAPPPPMEVVTDMEES
ncbi:MAG: OB-fold nucleic acid binding domain-containing protein, partial [Tepidisphaeraceae bacterium]